MGLCLLVSLLVLGLPACTPEPLGVQTGPQPQPVELPSPGRGSSSPAGEVVVATAAPVSGFLLPVGEEPAADDLAAIWGLPLLRVGPDGQLRPGLARDWQVRGATDRGWQVELHLRPGRWSDGSPVVAADVVASLRRQVREQPDRFGALVEVSAPARDRVRLVLHGPHAGWSDVLLEAGTVLPAASVDGAREAYEDDIPVSGGSFRLASHDPGRRLVFEAHAEGPLGPPGLERLVVLLVPSYETSLGLLERGDVDVVVGHLALNPVARAEELEGVRASAPIGGTTVALHFREGGELGGPGTAARRRGVVDAVDVGELVEGLLGAHGQVATSPWPGVPAPPAIPSGKVPGGSTVTLVHPDGGEALGFTARAVQRDLRRRDVTVELVPELLPEFSEIARSTHDISLRVHRSGPRPSLAPWVDEPTTAREAGPGSAQARTALTEVATSARIGPLYGIGAAHAWRGVAGLRPSSWLGGGFWNVGEWTRSS